MGNDGILLVTDEEIAFENRAEKKKKRKEIKRNRNKEIKKRCYSSKYPPKRWNNTLTRFCT